MAKRLSEKQKDEIVRRFSNGFSLDELSTEFNFTKSTIIKNLKKFLGEEEYKNLNKKNKYRLEGPQIFDKQDKTNIETKTINNNYPIQETVTSFDLNSFVEIAPLAEEINHSTQKDLSSIPIKEITFPKVVYMIVDKNIELNIKLLKDFPEWQFLPKDDLERKTIEVYYDLKIAKRYCKKDQKVIKVPNPNVFNMVAPILISKGISRIVTSENLIAL